MPRKPQLWFRMYVETIGDPKIRRLTPTERWVWVAILAAARQSPEPGVLLIADGHPMTELELAQWAAVRPRDVRSAIAKLEAMGSLRRTTAKPPRSHSRTTARPLIVQNFRERQYESDSSTPRTRRHRAKQGTVKERSNDRRRNNVGTHQSRDIAETEIVSSKGGTSSNAPRDPNDDPPRCTRHRDLPPDDPGPACRGCATAREKAEAQLEADTQAARDQAAARRAACTDCDADGWALDLDGNALAVKCEHPTIDNVVHIRRTGGTR